MKPAHIPRVIASPRLSLRAPDPANAKAFLRAQLDSRAELRRWMVWAQDEPTLQSVRVSLEGAAERFETGEQLRYLIWHAAGETLLGSSGFHALDWSVPKGEIGYWVATPHTGRGYAREAAEALTAFALAPVALAPAKAGGLGLRRLEIRCDARNERSRRIPEGLGYMLDGTLHNNERTPDGRELRDTLVFSRMQ